VAVLHCIADLPVAGKQRDDLPGDQCRVDPFPEQAGLCGLGQQNRSVAFAAAVVRASVLGPRGQLVE
jgi:hypothetical protein